MIGFVKLVFLIIILSADSFEAGKVLCIFPTPSISHQFVFRSITLELIKRGHEITVLTTDPMYPKGNGPVNLTEIDVHDISYKNWAEHVEYHLEKEKNDPVMEVKQLFKRSASTLDLQMETQEMKEILKRDKYYYDLILLEALNRPALGIGNVFDAPIIHISSMGAIPAQYDYFGAPMHPILYPTVEKQRLYNLTWREKIFDFLKIMLLDYLFKTTEAYDYSVMRKHFGEDVPSFDILLSNVKMIFINEHPFWAENRPITPNIIYIGGIHIQPQKELPKDLKSYLDSSKNGVIYVSFGTNVFTSLLPPEKVGVLTNVFAQLPYDILWKWDQDELPGKPNNVKISKWLPQADLLKHPKIKLFITQGGLQSTDETIDAAVPVIGIPMLADQWYNTEKYVRHNIGIQLDIETISENIFKDAIELIMNNRSYKENIIKLRGFMRDSPIKPADNAAWWAEHVMNYGGDHLQPPTRNMSWIEYYEVKLMSGVFIVVISVLILLVVSIVWTLKFILKLFYRSKLKTQ